MKNQIPLLITIRYPGVLHYISDYGLAKQSVHPCRRPEHIWGHKFSPPRYCLRMGFCSSSLGIINPQNRDFVAGVFQGTIFVPKMVQISFYGSLPSLSVLVYICTSLISAYPCRSIPRTGGFSGLFEFLQDGSNFIDETMGILSPARPQIFLNS